MDLCITGTARTRELLDVQEIVTAQRQVYIFTESVDDVPAFTQACTAFEQQILRYASSL